MNDYMPLLLKNNIRYGKYLIKTSVRELMRPSLNNFKIGLLSGGYVLCAHSLMRHFTTNGDTLAYICMAAGSSLISYVFVHCILLASQWCLWTHHVFHCCLFHEIVDIQSPSHNDRDLHSCLLDKRSCAGCSS